MYYKSTDIMRKIGSSTKPRSPQTTRRTASRAEDRSQNPDLAGPRPPPPGRGMRGEQGHLAYLLRVALLTPQTVGVIIRNLERDGAIRKTPHPVHGRVLQWTLSRRGAMLLGQCRRHANALEHRLMAGVPLREQLTVRRWLSKIAADLQQDA